MTERLGRIFQVKITTAIKSGTYPQGALLAGSDGALYGTTSEGGLFVNKGTVFKLTPPAGGGSAWSETVLYQSCPN